MDDLNLTLWILFSFAVQHLRKKSIFMVVGGKNTMECDALDEKPSALDKASKWLVNLGILLGGLFGLYVSVFFLFMAGGTVNGAYLAEALRIIMFFGGYFAFIGLVFGLIAMAVLFILKSLFGHVSSPDSPSETSKDG